MPVVRDNSIGDALGVLAGGLTAAFDPKRQWEAYAFKQRVQNMQLDNQKTQWELDKAKQEQAARAAAESAVVGEFDRIGSALPKQVEAPRPMENFQGPGMPVANPEISRLNTARELARAALRTSGGGGALLDSGYRGIGMGGVYTGGVPTNETDARRVQTMLTGKLPGATDAFTDEQRRVLMEEKRQNSLKDAVTVPKEGAVILSPEQGRAMGIQPDPTGVYRLDGPGPRQNGVFGGTSMDAQASNIVLQYEQARSSGQPITPEMERAYQIAKWHLTQPKTQVGADGRIVTTEPVLPSFGGGGGGPVPGAGATQVSSPPGVSPPPAGTVSAPPPVPAPVPVPAAPGSGPVLPPGGPQITNVPGARVSQMPSTKFEPTPEHVKRSGTFITTMDDAKRTMDTMFAGGFRPSVTGEALGPMARPGGGGIGSQLQTTGMNVAQGLLAPKDQQYWGAAMAFLNAVLRDESGAAVPEQEYPRYIATLIPSAGDTPEAVQDKLARQQAAIDARRRGMSLDHIKLIANVGAPLPRTGEAPSAPAPGAPAAPSAPAVQPGTVDAVRLRQDAEAAIAKIDQSGLPPSEKERRKAIIMQRLQSSLGGK